MIQTVNKKTLDFLHSRLFNFFLLPFLVGIIYAFVAGAADLQLRLLIISQMFFINMVAFFLAKAITAGVSSEATYNEAMKGNAGAGLAYTAIMIVRVSIYFTMIYGYAALINSQGG
jgi:hypothetical protein